MKNKKPNAAVVWKQMEDLLAPQLNFSLADRAVYSHLFRHSRLIGKPALQFSLGWRTVLDSPDRVLARRCGACLREAFCSWLYAAARPAMWCA